MRFCLLLYSCTLVNTNVWCITSSLYKTMYAFSTCQYNNNAIVYIIMAMILSSITDVLDSFVWCGCWLQLSVYNQHKGRIEVSAMVEYAYTE